ncbi:protein tyrosine/serine/threonine phosphatase [Fragilaria crotonensis]|nr:protein tyrosine/serine/threonine phosphatase [Fragilaria crotonensis]
MSCFLLIIILPVAVTAASFVSYHDSVRHVSAHRWLSSLSSSSLETGISPIHNFGPVSKRDQILFTAERPGHPVSKNMVPSEMVTEWISFMKDKGITHVLVLLDSNEMDVYSDPGLIDMYRTFGMEPHVVPMGSHGAYTRIMEILKTVEESNQKAVTHCTGGVGRAGRVAAAWLTTRYNLTVQDATQEVMEMAMTCGIKRLGDVQKLELWMDHHKASSGTML